MNRENRINFVVSAMNYLRLGFYNFVSQTAMLRTLLIAFLLMTSAQSEEQRTMEQTLSSLANIVIPSVEFSGDTTVEEAIDFLNQRLHEPDPPPPKQWKILLDIPAADATKKISIKGKNLRLHQVLGKIADAIGAEVIVTKDGFTLRQASKKDLQKTTK